MRLGTGADGRVGHRPVHRQPERAPQLFEGPLVALGERQAQLHEVGPRDRHRLAIRIQAAPRGDREVGVVGDGWVTAHPEVVLHPPLGGQAVVVPAHRVEHLHPAHPLVAGDRVGVRVGEHVPDVQRAADGRGRRVDRVDALARGRAVEAVGALALPHLGPLRLQAGEAGALGHARLRCLRRGQGS